VLKKGDIFAGYAIQRVLGQGGMGTVYLAQHPRLPRLTALKLLNRDLYTDTEIRRRFEREADLVAQLDHPNIVTVYDRGTEDEQLWISMQFVPGARFKAGQPARSTEPPNGTGAPRMPLPPRRTPRPGTIALPDVRVRPPRSASSGPEQHPPP
jgi:serine/threonine protein kinase